MPRDVPEIVASTERFERWLRARLGRLADEEDLVVKHRRMADNPFAFLRATYWRWCETVPDLSGAPRTLAVGDVHVENFGTWRDVEGRLVFGVNDFDEAAEMPWPHDLLRLATSALLGAEFAGVALPAAPLAATLREAYAQGIAAPCPIILDAAPVLRRRLEVVSEAARAAFWAKENALAAKPHRVEVPPAFAAALGAAFPPGATITALYRRQAGLGARGRPRFAAIASFQGGSAVREAKAMLPSAWTLLPGQGPERNRTAAAASGRYRSPDPWLVVADGIARRRLSPNNRKIEFPADEGTATTPLPLRPRVLRAMARDLGAIHAATDEAKAAIMAALEEGPHDAAWLAREAEAMAQRVRKDQRAFRRHWRAAQRENG